MANPIPKPILGSFEDIGESVVNQLKQIPKDVGQAAIETIGLSTGGKKGNTAVNPPPGATGEQGSHYQKIDMIEDANIKKIIARKALEEIIQAKPQTKEQSIWEKIQQEEEQKKAQKA